jgi:sigma-B regulation protein RsbU (phosphoserine phosphatase)
MKINFHGLAFKQSVLILVGISVVFAALFGLGSFELHEKMSQMLLQNGDEVSRANVALVNNLFYSGRNIGEETSSEIGKEGLYGEELDEFLLQTLSNVRATVPQVVAMVVAYEPGKAPKGAPEGEYMRLAYFSGDSSYVINGGNYEQTSWYLSAKDSLKGIWQEPFIGQFIKEPIVIYTTPIFRTDAAGEKEFVGVLCVDISIAFLKDVIANMPVSNSGYAVVLSANNMVIAHPKDELTFKSTFTSVSRNASHKRYAEFENALRSMKSGLFLGSSFDGEEAAIYFTAMESINWTFLVVWPAQTFLEERRSMGHVFVWVSIGGYIIMLLLILAITFRVSRPLQGFAAAAEKIGRGDFEAEVPVVSGKDELSELSGAFAKMRSSLKKFMNDQMKLDRAERELDLARGIQLGFLPKSEREEGCADRRHSLAPFLMPMREVGGDYYDFFKIDDDRIVFFLADVTGSGVPAALFMMVSRIVLRIKATHRESVADVLNEANSDLAHHNRADMFVSVWIGVLDLRNGHVDFASAGHRSPAVRHKDGSVEFVKDKTGLVLAAMGDSRYEPQSLELAPGDLLFLYNDGVTETMNSSEKMFGRGRLQIALSESAGKSPKETCMYVKACMDKFTGNLPQADDIAMFAIQYFGPEGEEKDWRQFTAEKEPEEQVIPASLVKGFFDPLSSSSSAQLKIEKTRQGGVLTLALEGRLDMLTSEQLDAEIHGKLDGVSQLVFDFAKLSQVSSAGLKILLASQKTMNMQGTMIIKNANAAIREIFDVTGFSDIMTLE